MTDKNNYDIQAVLAIREFVVNDLTLRGRYFVPRFAVRDEFTRLFAVFLLVTSVFPPIKGQRHECGHEM